MAITEHASGSQTATLDNPGRASDCALMLCTIEGCDQPVRSRGLCKLHYGRWYHKGDPLIEDLRTRPVEERFWEKVEKGPGCWRWTGATRGGDYGVFRVGGRDVPMVQAHRVAYELEKGPIPDGQVVCHRCDNPACVRPDHLFAGSQSENIRDQLKKGRHRSQRHRYPSRLSDEQIKAIQASSLSQASLGRRYGVSRSYIGLIKQGKRRRADGDY